MMHKHEHEECEHKSLQYCSHCEVVFCSDCDEEWGKKRVIYRDRYIEVKDKWERFDWWRVPAVTWGTNQTYNVGADYALPDEADKSAYLCASHHVKERN